MNPTLKVILIASAAAAVGAIVQVWVGNRFSDSKSVSIPNGAQPSNNNGSQWNPVQSDTNLNMEPYQPIYSGVGGSGSRSNFNGVIWTQRFTRGGNPNAGGNGGRENSWAFQTATKNPYANGTNCSYASAVLSATQDPTNQATSLVLGPGIAPNNPAE